MNDGKGDALPNQVFPHPGGGVVGGDAVQHGERVQRLETGKAALDDADGQAAEIVQGPDAPTADGLFLPVKQRTVKARLGHGLRFCQQCLYHGLGVKADREKAKPFLQEAVDRYKDKECQALLDTYSGGSAPAGGGSTPPSGGQPPKKGGFFGKLFGGK